jgi:hypothetical protein
MLLIFFGVFMVLHGLVHLLYFGQSQRFFQLQPGMTWPDGAWAFSRLTGSEATRSLASILCLLIAATLIMGGIGIIAKWDLWRPIVIGGAVLSTLTYLLLWNGKMRGLDQQGGIGILINLAILAALLIFRWPKFGF